jgi:predicted membrane metal-binding protein
LVCGKKLNATESYGLRGLGLYHLMVVSGAHLIIAETWIRKISFQSKSNNNWFVFALLGVYVGMTNWGPPVVRAWIQCLTQASQQRYQLGWRKHESSFISGLVALAIFPEFASLLSFQLSWIASLAIGLAPKHLMKSNAICYLLILPILSQLGAPHPASILANLIFAPILGAFLLPAVALCFVLPISGLMDYVWHFILLGGDLFTKTFSTQSISLLEINGVRIWLYIAALHLALALYRRRLHEQTS